MISHFCMKMHYVFSIMLRRINISVSTTQIKGNQIQDGTIKSADVDDSLEKDFTKARVTTGDSSPDFLSSKIIAGDNITLNVIGVSGSAQLLAISSSGGAGGAPASATYVTLTTNDFLTNERALKAGTGLNLIDSGAGSDVTLGVNDSIVATVSGSRFVGVTKHSAGLSGSLTKLSDGTSYLIAGTRMMITTGSTGAVTVSHSGSINVTEALTIGATTTAPTKATTRVQDFIQLTDDGSGWCHVEASYFAASPSGAGSGSGNYLYTLPGGYQFDTTIHPTNTQLTTLSGWEQVNKMIGATGIVSQEGNSSFNNYVVPYSSTQFRIIAHSPSQYAYLGSSYYLMTVANNQFRLSFRFKKA